MNFRYFDERLASKIFLNALLDLILTVWLIYINNHVINNKIFIPIAIVVIIAFVWSQKSRLVKIGKCEIGDSSIKFTTDDASYFIEFKSILSYKAQWNNGIRFTIKTNNNQKVVFVTNDNFHFTQDLEIILDRFENKIREFQENTGLIIKRAPSFYDYAIALPILIILTILFFIYFGMLLTSEKMTSAFFAVIFFMGKIWGDYISSKR